MRRLRTADSPAEVEIDLKPFINFLVVLIPVLMLSAEFAKVSVVNLSLPARAGVDPSRPDTGRAPEPEAALRLTMLVCDSAVTLATARAILPSLAYREFHTYVDRQDRSVRVTVEAAGPAASVRNPRTGRPFSVAERQEIELFAVDSTRALLGCLYSAAGEIVSDTAGQPVRQLRAGQTVLLGASRRVTVADPKVYRPGRLSLYDALRLQLSAIHGRCGALADADEITIAAQGTVAYDKIVQLMDVARGSGFSQVAITRLRS